MPVTILECRTVLTARRKQSDKPFRNATRSVEHRTSLSFCSMRTCSNDYTLKLVRRHVNTAFSRISGRMRAHTAPFADCHDEHCAACFAWRIRAHRLRRWPSWSRLDRLPEQPGSESRFQTWKFAAWSPMRRSSDLHLGSLLAKPVPTKTPQCLQLAARAIWTCAERGLPLLPKA